MSAVAAKTVMPFPFESLPRATSDQIALRAKLSALYGLMQDRADLLQAATAPLGEILRRKIVPELIHLEVMTLEELLAALPERFVFAAVRTDPHAKRAFVVLDSVFAGLLVDAVLSDGRAPLDKLALNQVRPLTPLSEAVAEYAVASAIEKLSPALGDKNFSLCFESVARDPKKVKGLYAPADSFAVFSVRLIVDKREFFLKAGLPLSVAEIAGASRRGEGEFFRSRLEGFLSFRVDLEMVAGRVELSPDELAGLSPGDVVLLDESFASLDGSRRPCGKVLLCPVGGDDGGAGFLAELTNSEDGFKARIVSGLE